MKDINIVTLLIPVSQFLQKLSRNVHKNEESGDKNI